MVKIGHVDMGSSHPAKFIKVLRNMGYLYHGIYDDLHMVNKEYLEHFAQKNEVMIYPSIEDMVNDVDIAFIYSINWDLHVDKVKAFVEKGKGVYIDKPICGSVRDINKLDELYKQGARITGGSSVLYSDAVLMARENELALGGKSNFIFAGAPNDVFYYGIHILYMICGVMGFDISSVRYIGQSIQKLYELTWRDDKKAVIAVGNLGRYYSFFMTLFSDFGIKTYTVSGDSAVGNMLLKVVPHLLGTEDEIIPINQLLNCEKALLACVESEKNGGRMVALDYLPDHCSYSGLNYENSYKIK